MTFATTKTLIAMTIVWAIACFGIDYEKNPKAFNTWLTPKTAEQTADRTPTIKMHMNHLCCTGCLSDVTKALEKIPTIKVKQTPLESQEQADMDTAKAGQAVDYGHDVELEVPDLKTVDFMAIDRALRDAGLTAETMLVSGPAHFHLRAEVKHICCGLCSTGLKEGLAISAGLKGQGRFKWLDSFAVDKPKKEVLAYAKYQEAADVMELLTALNRVGFQPNAIFVESGAEGVQH